MIVTTIAAVLVGFVIGTHYTKEKNNMEKNKNIKARIVGRTRRGKVVRLVTALVMVPALAWALTWMLGITGTIGVKADPTVAWTTKNSGGAYDSTTVQPVVVGDGTGNSGTATVSGGKLTLNVKDMYPSTSVTVAARVWNDTSDLVLAGIDLGLTDATAQIVKGSTLTTDTSNSGLPSIGCGEPLAVPHSSQVTPKTSVVAFKVTVPAGTAGGSKPLPAGAGVTVMPKSEWNALTTAEKDALCTNAG